MDRFTETSGVTRRDEKTGAFDSTSQVSKVGVNS